MNVRQVKQAFAAGTLLHPVCETPGFLDLTQVLATRLGVSWPGSSRKRAAVAGFIGDADHIVFVLVDGMGWTLLNLLPPTAFLRSQRMMELRAIFPSTTSCALTTLATGLWPGQHGVPGWWVYLDERNLSVTALPFQERYTESPLDAYGVKVEDIWPFAPWMKGSIRDSLSFLPNGIPESIFSRYSRGYTPGTGYRTIADVIDAVIQRVANATKPSYTYLYLPEFDGDCHHHGVDSPEAAQTLAFINTELERLATGLHGRARLVISADHGHANVTEVNRHVILDGDPLLELLKVPPTAEPRVPVFHIRDGCHEALEKAFAQRFSDEFVLLSTAQVESMKLLGPEPLSPLAKRRFGDYIGIAIKPVTLKYKAPQHMARPDHLGYHAGLSPAEMRIPLIVARV